VINRGLDLRVVSRLSNCAQNCAFGRAGLLDDWVRWENSASAGVIGEDQVGITGITRSEDYRAQTSISACSGMLFMQSTLVLRLPRKILGLVDWRLLAIA
jgi:hypothetical protein